MSRNPSTVLDPPAIQTEQIAECLEAFQAALNRDERPALAAFLPSGSAAAAALVELVRAELEFRLQRGEAARVEEYLAHYPQLAGDPIVLADLAASEYHLRRRSEPTLHWDSYRERFPEHRDALDACRLDTSRHGDGETTLPLPAASRPAAADFPFVSGYEILSELGRGAMGVVYKARQIALHRIVALKMLHAARRGDAEQRLRFRNEVEIIARLQHPNIVQVHDVGEHDGRPFFTMEFLGGGSLADHAAGQTRSPRAAAELIEALARAMQAVHAKGIVHRDLKPSNVVRAADGSPKITDFGLAHQESSDLTATGEVLGTPNYMAPEQAAGKVREIGPAADVYALGAMLYELLTGRPPFRGLSVMELVRRVQDSDPVAPRKMEPRTPRDLETICLKCLRKELGRRYAGAGELADDLRRFLQGESILARPPAWPERVGRWTRRHPAIAVLFAVLIVAALVVPLALLGHTLQLQAALDREQAERDRARAAEEQARRKETEARVAHFVADLKLASTLFNNGEVFQLPSLLEPYRRDGDPANDPRGFAWWYLHPHGREARPALAAHDGPLHLLAYAPDGRTLVTSGGSPEKQSLRVWDRHADRPRWQRSLFASIFDRRGARAAYARQGALLAGVVRKAGDSERPRVVVWDFASENIKFQIDNVDEVQDLALSPDGRWLAVAHGGRVAVWDCAAARERCMFPALGEARLTFAPVGDTLLMSGGSDSFRGLQWRDATTGALRQQLPTSVRFDSLSFSPRGTFLLLIDADGQGAIWESSQGVALDWSSRIGRVRSLAMSADERTLAAGDEAGVVRIWDVAARRWRGRYRWQPAAIVGLAFAPDDRTLSAATAEGQVHPLHPVVRHAPDSLAAARMRDGPLAWSPDGEILAVAGEGCTVHLFDRRAARERLVLRCPFQNVRCLAFSPDGRTLATACEGESGVRLWNVQDGRQRAMTPLQTAEIAALVFAPDGRLATADDKTVRFWNAVDGTACGELPTERPISALAFTSEGRTLLTGGSVLQVWKLGDGGLSSAKLASRVPMTAPVVRLAVTRDGRRAATSEANGPVRLWRLAADGQLTPDGQAPVNPSDGRGLDFTPDGKTLFVCHSGGNDVCSLWNPPDSFCRINLFNARGATSRAALSPDGRTIATVGGALRLWDASTCRAIRPAGQALVQVSSLVFSADGRDLLTASRLHGGDVRSETWGMKFHGAVRVSTAESLRLWDAATGQERPANLPSRDTMASPALVAASPDGRLVAAGAEDGSVQIWDRREKQWLTRLFVSEEARRYAAALELARAVITNTCPKYRDESEPLAALAFSPDGRYLAASGARGSVRVWAADGWTECCCWRVDPPGSPWLAFTPDSRAVAGSLGGQVRIWNARTGELQSTRGEFADACVLCGAFVPGADVLAFGSKDGLLRLWDRRTGDVKRLPGAHQDRVTSLAFAPDGKTLASVGWDRTVRLWNMRAGREVAVLEGHKGRIHAVAFSPDGTILASGGENGEFRGEVLLWRR